MTKIDIYSGFLGAGKTTLIKKMISEGYGDQKLVLIENEFGEIGIDGGFLQDAGINITEMNSGCICCSLVGDFGKALEKVIAEYHPDRVIIEPSVRLISIPFGCLLPCRRDSMTCVTDSGYMCWTIAPTAAPIPDGMICAGIEPYGWCSPTAVTPV